MSNGLGTPPLIDREGMKGVGDTPSGSGTTPGWTSNERGDGNAALRTGRMSCKGTHSSYGTEEGHLQRGVGGGVSKGGT